MSEREGGKDVEGKMPDCLYILLLLVVLVLMLLLNTYL